MKRFIVAFLLFSFPALAEDLAPGTVLHITPDTLPAPYATKSSSNGPKTVPRPPGTLPNVPPGFKVNLFADGLERARWLMVLENGDVLLAQDRLGQITLLKDENKDGRADAILPFASGFKYPHGMAYHLDHLYVTDLNGVWRIPYKIGDLEPIGRFTRITPKDALGDHSGHRTRIMAVHPDGNRFVVSVGSATNNKTEPEPFATIQEFLMTGKEPRTLATGLRNPVGVAYHPTTGELYTVVNERDGLGDELPPDFMTSVKDGGFYGWPYNYTDKTPPKEITQPEVLFRAHSAPLGLAFYTGDSFPAEYKNDAFVGLHGSWNAKEPRGYMVARVPFENGKPTGKYEVFASGFWAQGATRAKVWGRPVAIAVAKDGSLLVADDTGKAVWRISYVGE